MLSRMILAGLLVLSVAACTAGAAPSASPAPTPVPATTVAVPSATPAPAAKPLEVAVIWDGSTCAYVGPEAIPDGTLTRFTFTGSDQMMLVVVGVLPGTTWDQIVASTKTHAASDPPGWVILTGIANIPGNSSGLFTISAKRAGTPVGGYFVGCSTAPKPEGTDVMYPGALLRPIGA